MSDTQDPYLWLEDLEGEEAAAWVAGQNARTQARLDADPRFAGVAGAVLANLRDTRQIPFFTEYQGWLYNFHQDAEHPRGVYRRTTLDGYRGTAPDWQTVLDIDTLAAAEGEDWYLDGVSHYTLSPEHCLVHLTRGGQDATVSREYHLGRREFVDGGFAFPEGKNHVTWRTLDEAFVCPAWHDEQLTRAGYPREVWLARRGEPWSMARRVLQLPEDAMMAIAWRFLGDGVKPVDIVEASDGFYSKQYFILNNDDALSPLPLPAKADIEGYLNDAFIVRLAEPWRWADTEHAAGSLLAVPRATLVAGAGPIEVLLAPTSRQSVSGIETTRRFVVVNLLDNVQSRLVAFEPLDTGWRRFELPTPETGVIEFVDQPWQTDILSYSFSDYLTPAGLYRVELPGGEPECLRAQPAAFDAGSYVAEQWQANAPDGEAIPYFVVRRRDAPFDGSTPTLLYGYGGFEVPMLPHYVDNFGPHWLEKGGAFVVACIRGGGEFGPAWHQAAQRANKPVSFADFIAVAEDLVARGLTSSNKLAIEGGSNGGLLVGAAMVMRPDLFGAVVCEVPLLDMLRYTELHAGASWIDEYGDPEDELEAEALAAYSPYQRVENGVAYPSVFFTTSARDDRVHPAHARKMAAKLQGLGRDALFFETGGGGHSGNTDQAQTADELARVLVYLYQRLIDAE
ncbi:prolyl oligopeptidase family serine peptidase [Crenobacter cavernae]|uniref:S9 family peptidase n=1 Tax=Crenobacter cavernae TaxID=2290923 RepID=A0A345Y469_9NEIS|nr:prolyl oligopeptidase family serine peptidase [Crenobacter cavernae]AXK38721.1 S9 family peptidase [Crenobacter cavernae]